MEINAHLDAFHKVRHHHVLTKMNPTDSNSADILLIVTNLYFEII